MEGQRKDQNVKFKKSAIDFKAIKSTSYPSFTSEDETIHSASVSTKIMEALTSSEIIGKIIPTCQNKTQR